MQSRVLVTYATKYGATAEIAEKVALVLRQSGLLADVLPTGKVSGLHVYQAVVLGSAVYIGAWRGAAAKFLKKNEKALAELPAWLFSSGPTGEGDPLELQDGWGFPKALQPVADRIKPRDVVVFHGAVDVKKLNPLHKWMIGKVEAPVGDFRDWVVITAWAKAIADALLE